MNANELCRRIETLSSEQIVDIKRMLREGYSARGITLEYPATLKQVNAVVEMNRLGDRFAPILTRYLQANA